MALFANVRSLSFVNYIGVDDFSDRLSYQISGLILAGISMLVTARTYAMKPISCYIPQSFGFEKGGQIDFVDQYCLTEGTYAVAVKDFRLSAEKEDGGLSEYAGQKIYYYQWVPFVLAFQAVMCCLPRLLWRLVSFDRAGTDVGRIVRLAKDAAEDTGGGETRKRMVTHIARLIERLIKRRRTQTEEAAGACAPLARAWRLLARIMPSNLSGSCLILTYLVIKLAYFLNSVAQLLTIQKFLQLNTTRFGLPGVQLIREALAVRDWQNAEIFPRVGSCAVLMRSAAGANWLYAQCALPVNMINEKVYVFLWFWFFVVSAVTVVSIIGWVYRLACRFSLINFVKDYLRLADNYNELRMKKPQLNKFVKHYLSRDGAFLLKMIALNCGDMVCADVVNKMWENFVFKENVRTNMTEGDRSAEVQFRPEEPGIFRLDCQGLPSAVCRRGILKRQQSAPAPASFNPDADELVEYATGLQKGGLRGSAEA